MIRKEKANKQASNKAKKARKAAQAVEREIFDNNDQENEGTCRDELVLLVLA